MRKTAGPATKSKLPLPTVTFRVSVDPYGFIGKWGTPPAPPSGIGTQGKHGTPSKHLPVPTRWTWRPSSTLRGLPNVYKLGPVLGRGLHIGAAGRLPAAKASISVPERALASVGLATQLPLELWGPKWASWKSWTMASSHYCQLFPGAALCA